VGAADVPPIRRDPPGQPQTGVRLQRGRPPARAGGIEAGLFVLLSCPARFVWTRASGGVSSIARHFISAPSDAALACTFSRRRRLPERPRSRCSGESCGREDLEHEHEANAAYHDAPFFSTASSLASFTATGDHLCVRVCGWRETSRCSRAPGTEPGS